jgi:hypothetical protein
VAIANAKMVRTNRIEPYIHFRLKLQRPERGRQIPYSVLRNLP